MSFHSARTWGLGALALAAVASIGAVPGQALTMKECSAKIGLRRVPEKAPACPGKTFAKPIVA